MFDCKPGVKYVDCNVPSLVVCSALFEVMFTLCSDLNIGYLFTGIL